MIERKTLARPYAKAIFELATKSHGTQVWAEVLCVLAQIAQDGRVLTLLKDANLNTKTLGDFFMEIFQASIQKDVLGKSLDYKQISNFLSVLAFRKRLELLPEIQVIYEEYYQAAEGRINVQLKAPVSLDAHQKEKYQSVLEKYFSRKISLECVVDKSLLGGFIARAGNFVMNASVRENLSKLKQELMG